VHPEKNERKTPSGCHRIAGILARRAGGPNPVEPALHRRKTFDHEAIGRRIFAGAPAPEHDGNQGANRDFGRLAPSAGRLATGGVQQPLDEPAQIEYQRNPLVRVGGVELAPDHGEAGFAMWRERGEPSGEYAREARGEDLPLVRCFFDGCEQRAAEPRVGESIEIGVVRHHQFGPTAEPLADCTRGDSRPADFVGEDKRGIEDGIGIRRGLGPSHGPFIASARGTREGRVPGRGVGGRTADGPRALLGSAVAGRRRRGRPPSIRGLGLVCRRNP